VRFLPAALDVEHDGDVVTMFDSSRRHPGMSSRTLLWMTAMFLALGAPCVFLLFATQPATIKQSLELGAGAAFLLAAALMFFLMARIAIERRLIVDLRSGLVNMRWPDIEMAQWTGDVDGLGLVVCPMKIPGPVGLFTVSAGYASVAVLDGTLTPTSQAILDCGPLTRTMLRGMAAVDPSSTPRHHSNRGWIVLATGEDPDTLEAELRAALPTLTRVIEIERIEETLTGTVDAKLLRKPARRR